MSHTKSAHDAQRRKAVRKLVYVAPAILSLQAAPAYAKAGSEKPREPRPPSRKPGPPPRARRGR